MSLSMQRARPQMTAPLTSRAMVCTASKSPGLLAGKPASMTSTPRRTSWWAISSFSEAFRLLPGRLLAVAQRGVEEDDRLAYVAPGAGSGLAGDDGSIGDIVLYLLTLLRIMAADVPDGAGFASVSPWQAAEE